MTSPEVRVLKGKALVSLAPQASEATWESVLTESPAIALHAPEAVSWIEVWRLMSSGLWHIETQGIPLVHQPETQGTRAREWRPWRGYAVVHLWGAAARLRQVPSGRARVRRAA